MRVKLYIVTYDNAAALDANLQSLFVSARAKEFNVDVLIINNCSRFHLEDRWSGSVKVLHNVLRPDFSTGHLARNWNQAIINGFVNPNEPDCDILLTCQDDALWHDRSFERLFEQIKSYDFIANGAGDCFCAYTIDAVKAIGLWDERFCNIGYQEADYFFRAVNYHPEKSSINDGLHWRMWQPCPEIVFRPDHVFSQAHDKSRQYHWISNKVFFEKWGVEPQNWPKDLFDKKHTSKIKSYVYYPYFEMMLPCVNSTDYCVP